MAYDRQTWVLGEGGGTPLSATRMNHLEEGVEDAHTAIDALAEADHTHTSADITDATALNVVDTIVTRDATGSIAVTAVSGLSEATGNTQAVPKFQMDAALAAVAGTAHTHDTGDITDITATGVSLVSAVDADAARNALDTPSTTEVTAEIGAAIATERAEIDTDVAAAQAAANTYTDTAVDEAPIVKVHDGSSWPVRPDTSGTNRIIQWIGPASDVLATTGTSSGGTVAAAPNDLIYYHA
jgi:hypothetical protein